MPEPGPPGRLRRRGDRPEGLTSSVCGIALLMGSDARAHYSSFAAMMAAAAPRGEVEETLADDDVLIGTHRLRIVDRDRAVQPWLSADGRWALTYNGEIFNFAELRSQLIAEGRQLRSISDTEVVLEAHPRVGRGCAAAFPGRVRLRADRPADPPRVPGPGPGRGQTACTGRCRTVGWPSRRRSRVWSGPSFGQACRRARPSTSSPRGTAAGPSRGRHRRCIRTWICCGWVRISR